MMLFFTGQATYAQYIAPNLFCYSNTHITNEVTDLACYFKA